MISVEAEQRRAHPRLDHHLPGLHAELPTGHVIVSFYSQEQPTCKPKHGWELLRAKYYSIRTEEVYLGGSGAPLFPRQTPPH
ncbi:MAG: hypothetical protein M3463_07000 [Verrucomicrobiota bacterium]|nr:hypothetical protein [Verrucomicrobiota bacterium]